MSDGRTLYLIQAYFNSAIGTGRAFGDMSPYAASDSFCAFTIGGNDVYKYLSDTSKIHYVPRISAGTGAAQTGTRRSLFPVSGETHTAPSPIDGGVVLSRPVFVNESSAIRGEMRGVMACSANPIPSGSLFTIMASVTGVSGRVCVVSDGNSNSSCVAFPIDEDWP